MHDKLAQRWDAISLRTKITGVTVLLLTAGLVVAGLGTMAVLRGYLIEQVDRQLYVALGELGVDGTIQLSSADAYIEGEASPFNPYYLGVISLEGELLDDNLVREELQPNWPALDMASLPAGTPTITLRSVDRSTEWRLLLTPVVVSVNGSTAVLAIGMDLADADETVNRFGAVFLFFALTVIILGGALTRLLATTTFAPLRRLEAQAARFADGDYSQRLGWAPPNTEVGRLTRSLNRMLGRIDSAFSDRARTIEQMRRFVGDASHELRTPLVTVRGYAELYRMGALAKDEDVAQAMDRIEKEAVRMAELVEDLLELARLDQTDKPLELAPVDLVPIAHDAARDAMAGHPERTVAVIGIDSETLTAGPIREVRPADTPGTPMPVPDAENTLTRPITLPQPESAVGPTPTRPIPLLARVFQRRTRPIEVLPDPEELGAPAPDLEAVVLGAENKIRQVAANLVTNAIRYSPEDSPIEIGIGVDAATRRAVLAVIDHGDGVPPEIRDKIFQRFWRADTSRARETGGNGLGLAIVAAIVQAHHGSVDILDTPGGGATFRVWLPLA